MFWANPGAWPSMHNSSVAAVLGSMPQVEVLHHTSPGVVFSTGRVSSWNSELMQGWAGWVSADTEGRWLQDFQSWLEGLPNVLQFACNMRQAILQLLWLLKALGGCSGWDAGKVSLHAARNRTTCSRSLMRGGAAT
jgi:hypothetical protein